MSDPSVTEALAAAGDFVAHLSQYRHPDDGPADPAVIVKGPAADRFEQSMQALPADARPQIAARLAAGVADIPDPLPAAMLASEVGGMVEDGGDPVPLADALRARLPKDFAAARRFVELLEAEADIERPDDADPATLAEIGRRERGGASAWAALRFSTVAAMAVWCRHRPSRLAAKSETRMIEDAVFLGDRGGYCFFIGELLSAADGAELTVIAPEQHKGYVVELEAVRNAAHLFVLLEDVLVDDADAGLLTGPKADPRVAAIARGEGRLESADSFNVRWHYEYWWGLEPAAAAKAIGLHRAVAAMIGVEATVHDLPAFRGRPVMLMRPGKFRSRACDMSFFAPLHDALRSGVSVKRHLTADEVDTLCEGMRAEAVNLG